MASDDLRAHIAEAIRAAACDGHCGRSEQDCVAANPIEEVVCHFEKVAIVEAPVDALAEVAAGVVHLELERLNRQLDDANSELYQLRILVGRQGFAEERL